MRKGHGPMALCAYYDEEILSVIFINTNFSYVFISYLLHFVALKKKKRGTVSALCAVDPPGNGNCSSLLVFLHAWSFFS